MQATEEHIAHSNAPVASCKSMIMTMLGKRISNITEHLGYVRLRKDIVYNIKPTL